MSLYDDPAEFIRATIGEPIPKLLPWQKAFYEGKPRRLAVGGGRTVYRRMLMTSLIAEALRDGETVRVCAHSQGEADALMAEARRLRLGGCCVWSGLREA